MTIMRQNTINNVKKMIHSFRNNEIFVDNIKFKSSIHGKLTHLEKIKVKNVYKMVIHTYQIKLIKLLEKPFP